MSIDSLVNRYELDRRAAGMSPKTVTHVKRVVRFFDAFMGGIADVRTITADDLKRFIVACQQKTRWQGLPQEKGGKVLSGTSVNTYVRGIKAFWGWLKKQDLISENPLEKVPAPKLPKRLPKTLAEDELDKVLKASASSDRDSAIVELLYSSGIRLSELVGFNMNDIDMPAGVIKVFGKGGKEAYVNFGDRARAALMMYTLDSRPQPRGEDRFFLTEDGFPLTAGRVQKILERIGQKAGLTKRLSPHKLRHSFATHSLKNGMNLEYVRRSLRHTDIKTTEVYLSVADADLAAAHRKTDPLDNLLARHRR